MVKKPYKMEYSHTRDFSEFCEQLNEVRLKFYKWDSCEKTVALYYLMVGLPFANARFLQNALDQCINSVNNVEAQTLEQRANDPEIIASFLYEKPQAALYTILKHLPLLRPGNKKAAHSYLRTIRKVLTEFIQPPFKKIYNECVEIMSYVYIHPAFDNEDKKSFKHLLKQVLNKVSPENFVHSPVNESSDDSVSPNPESFQNKKRSNSLTPSGAAACEPDDWSSQENLVRPFHHKPRSYSLSNDKILTLPNISGSRSETHLREVRIMSNHPVMKSILSWLKSLRLHKYSWIFENITYAEMLNMTEEYLVEVGVTKGARHKLLLNLQKLRERSVLLSELETEVINGGDINCALKALKGILQSPLQVSLDEDLPSQFVKVIGKVCTQLLVMRQPSDENILLFNSLCERAETMDAFTEDHRRRLNMWKEQLAAGTSTPIFVQPQQTTKMFRPEKWRYPIPVPKSDHETCTMKSSSYPNMQNNYILNSHRRSIDSCTLQSQLRHTMVPQVDTSQVRINRVVGSSRHSSLQTQSNNRNSLDIESSLESLCLQMTEHALGP